MEDKLTFPADAISRAGRKNLAIDFGGSLIKVAYATESMDDKSIEIRMRTFTISNLEACLGFLREIGPWKEGEVAGIGIGLMKITEPVMEATGTSFEIMYEITGMVDCFQWLAQTRPKHEIVQEICKETVMAGEKTTKVTYDSLTAWTCKNNRIRMVMADRPLPENFYKWISVDVDEALPYAKADPGLYPCLFVMLGSAGVLLRLEDDNHHTWLNSACRCGRALIGMASLCLGITDFDEMMELAAKGNSNNIDMTFDEFACKQNGDASQDRYNAELEGDYVAHSFSKGYGKTLSSFPREDVMRTLLSNVVSDLAHIVTMEAELQGVQRVFFAGGLVTHPLVRQEFIRHLCMHKVFKPKSRVEYNFLRNAGHFPAIGALLGQILEKE